MRPQWWNNRPARALRSRFWLSPPLAPIRWAEESWRHLRRSLPVAGLEIHLEPPPRTGLARSSMIDWWLRWRRATCLERSLVVQAWLLASGEPHDLVIGVRRLHGRVIAHAWLDHEDSRGFSELLRLEPSRAAIRIPSGLVEAVPTAR